MTTVKVHELRKGDRIPSIDLEVDDVQVLDAITIIDFTDNTSSPPLSSHLLVEIERETS